MRTPAWTDRVLWRRNEGTGIEANEDDIDPEGVTLFFKKTIECENLINFLNVTKIPFHCIVY